jgi:hypothetical protein
MNCLWTIRVGRDTTAAATFRWLQIRWLQIGVLALLSGFCLAQERGGTDPRAAMPLIQEVLSKAQLSGSLEYWGRCEPHKVYPDFPQLRWPTGHDSSPLGFLQAMFDVDPTMRVTQEADGKVRMAETDIPNDLLNVKIHHLSFYPVDASESDPVHGSGMALLAILETAEVAAFGKAHNIEGLPYPDKAHILPGNCCGGGRIMHGELDDVTVSQALDYVLQTFPGFWLYENCQSSEGSRKVFFNFYPTLPASVYTRKTVPTMEKK